MAHRPHLVIDGAILAAEAIGADEIVFYVGVEHEAAARAMRRAIEERGARFERPMRIGRGPGRLRRRRGIGGRPLDRQRRRPPDDDAAARLGARDRRSPDARPERRDLASTALIARFGDAWYRSAGRAETRGTALITVSGADQAPTVTEVEIGTTIGEIARDAGVRAEATRAVIAGGYFGAWAPADAAWDLPLDPSSWPRRAWPSDAAWSGSCGGRLRPGRDREDHGVHGRRERRSVRTLRPRPPGDRGRDRPACRWTGARGRSRPGRAAGRADVPAAAPATTPTAPSGSWRARSPSSATSSPCTRGSGQLLGRRGAGRGGLDGRPLPRRLDQVRRLRPVRRSCVPT